MFSSCKIVSFYSVKSEFVSAVQAKRDCETMLSTSDPLALTFKRRGVIVLSLLL